MEERSKLEKKSKLKTSFSIVILIALLTALFINIVILFNTISKKNATLNFFHWKPFIVESDSAEANVNSGDMAIIKDVKIEKIKPGDDIVCKRGNDAVIKQVKAIKNINGQNKIIIEDDNDGSINSSIEGVYMFKIAGLGNVILFLQTPLGGIILFAIFIFIIVIIKLISSKSSKKENNQTHDNNSSLYY